MEPSKRKYIKHKKDYKITSKYYLDKRKSSTSDNSNKSVFKAIKGVFDSHNSTEYSELSKTVTGKAQEDKNSLYIRITAKGQLTVISSRLGMKLTETEFKGLLFNPIYKELIQNEVFTIEQTIRSYGVEMDDFNIKDWLFSYSRNLLHVDEYIKAILVSELYTGLESEYSIHPYFLSKIFTDESFDVVGTLAKMGIQTAIDLKSKYGPLLTAQEIQSRLSDLSTINYQYCLLDCFTGMYQDHIKTRINSPDAHLYLERFEELIMSDALIPHRWYRPS